MGSTPLSIPFFGRHLNLFILIFILFSLSSSVKEIQGHPPHSGDWHRSRDSRIASEPPNAKGKRPETPNARQTPLLSQRQTPPVRRTVAATEKDELFSERRRVTKIPVMEKANIRELEKDPSTDSDEKTRSARKSPTAKITVPLPLKETTLSPLSIQVKTFTPKPNVSAVIEVIADARNTSEYKENKNKEPPIEYVHLSNIRTDELRLMNWYPFKDPRAPFGTYPAAGEINDILPVEEIVLFGSDAGYGNQQPIYPSYALDVQNFAPGNAALGAKGYEPSVFLNAQATVPLVPNPLVASQWLPNLQPHTQKYVTGSFHLKLDPKIEWVPI